MADNDFAVAIGITHYPQIVNLKGPGNDANNMYQWLIDPTGGAVPEDQAYKLISSEVDDDGNPRPIQGEVEAVFDQLQAAVELKLTAGQMNRLYIYMAGHGIARTGEVSGALLLMANANVGNRIGYYVNGPAYAAWFREAAYFKEIVLLMDCCRAIAPTVPERGIPWPRKPDAAAAGVRMFTGYATRLNALSREAQLPPPDGAWQGCFTRAILDALKNADADANGHITARSIKNFVLHTLPLISPAGAQEPEITIDDDEMVMATVAAQTLSPLTIEPKPPVDVTAKLLGPSFEDLGTYNIAQPVILPLGLPSGFYGLQRSDTLKIYSFGVLNTGNPLTCTVNVG